jgi:hypothetical protein
MRLAVDIVERGGVGVRLQEGREARGGHGGCVLNMRAALPRAVRHWGPGGGWGDCRLD